MSVEACKNFMSAFRDNLKELMEDQDGGDELVFNADQSALYFKRFPCTTIIAKEQSNSIKGNKVNGIQRYDNRDGVQI